jgi:hypothetical protein
VAGGAVQSPSLAEIARFGVFLLGAIDISWCSSRSRSRPGAERMVFVIEDPEQASSIHF